MRLFRIHSLADARAYYETALSMVAQTRAGSTGQGTYIDIALKWAEVCQYTPSNKIRQALNRALAYAQDANRRDRSIHVSYWIGRFGYMQGEFIDAVQRIKTCIRWSRRHDERKMLGLSMTLLGRATLYTGEFKTGLRRLHAVLERIVNLRTLAQLSSMKGDEAQADVCRRQWIALSRRTRLR